MKRFIAGAQCPICQNTDTLYLDTETQGNVVACTRCDYRDIRGSDAGPPKETQTQPVKSEKPVIWH